MNKSEFKALYSLLRTARTKEMANTYRAEWMDLGYRVNAHRVVLCIVSNYEYPPMRLTKEERNMNRKLP